MGAGEYRIRRSTVNRVSVSV